MNSPQRGNMPHNQLPVAETNSASNANACCSKFPQSAGSCHANSSVPTLTAFLDGDRLAVDAPEPVSLRVAFFLRNNGAALIDGLVVSQDPAVHRLFFANRDGEESRLNGLLDMFRHPVKTCLH